MAVAPRPSYSGENDPVLIEPYFWKKQKAMGKPKTACQQRLVSGWRFITHYLVLFKQYITRGLGVQPAL
jgi:hypothetical protein